MKLGYIGLGKMGGNMAERLLEKGHELVVTDPNGDAVTALEAKGAVGAGSATELVSKLEAPRLVWIMVPHRFVDDVLGEITPHLQEGDVVIDGGNSPYMESIRRGSELKSNGVDFIDAGVSGGPEGARNGACVMIGGEKEVYAKVEQLFKDIAAPDAYKYLGRSGAGHFVKMVHNGIEYGMMEAIAEGFNIMKNTNEFDLSLIDVADIYQHESVITSRLIGWLKNGFEKYGEDLAEVSGSAGASGEGEWTIKVAKELGVDVASMEHALSARLASQKQPGYDGKLIQTMRNMFGGHSGKTDITS